MIIPGKENYTEMSSSDFEKFTLRLLHQQAALLPNAEFTHNETIAATDGTYQIDGTIRFELMGVHYLTLVECKKYNSPISREKVQILYDKIRTLGAQKGILATTSYFQTGAIQYASLHGIALVQIVDGKLLYEVRSAVKPKKTWYPPNLEPFAAVMQQMKDGQSTSIYCSNISFTDSLIKFLKTDK